METKAVRGQVCRIRVGDVCDWTLSRHQDTFIMESLQHLQRAVGQNNLLRGDLQKDRERQRQVT